MNLKRLGRTVRGRVVGLFSALLSARAGMPLRDGMLVAEIRRRNLTYLSKIRLNCLARECRRLEAMGVEGAVIEAGCALGGSSILLARTKTRVRPLVVYDVFGMIPSPTADDPEEVHDRYRTIQSGGSKGIGGDRYYGYEYNLYETVRNNLASFDVDCTRDNVDLVRGLVQETMKIDRPVALAHVDVDWYEPVMTCLQQIVPKLSVGGSLILDDYHDWGGCRKAVDEYFSGIAGCFEMDDSAGSLRVTRVAAGT